VEWLSLSRRLSTASTYVSPSLSSWLLHALAKAGFLAFLLQIGDSLYDADGAGKASALLEKAKKNNVKVVFPVDYVTADKFDKDAQVRSRFSSSSCEALGCN
jgi:3-phosphoglycerate kinase